MAQARITKHDVGTCDQRCESCGQHFVLLYLWDFVAPGEGRWVCLACLPNALYGDAVAIVEAERAQLYKSFSRPGYGSFAFGAGADERDVGRLLHRLAQKLQRRPAQLLGLNPLPRRFRG